MRATNRGFTFVEMLIVIALLGLLAAVAIPQLATPSAEARSATLLSGLTTLRSAVDTYWAQHETFPGQSGVEQFTNQLCRTSNDAGRTGEGSEYPLGPYLHEGTCPVNPFAGDNTVRVVERMPSGPQGDEAWIYDRSTGQVRCNVAGATADGTRYFEL